MVTRFRVVTLNLEQDHKRWDERSPLVVEGMKALQPDIIALNEVSIARQTARELQRELRRNIGSVQGIDYNLVQQTRVNGLASVEGEALLTRFAVVETGNLDFQTRDMVAQVARILVDGKPLDVYVTHLYMSVATIRFGCFKSSSFWNGSISEKTYLTALSAETSTRHWTCPLPP
jgi:endonuclease/exonuclease/phosphatase family metal-dependent hydrolase